jgi:thiamine-monophosphate kinase
VNSKPRPSEDEIIANFFAPLAGPAGLGLVDDAALLSLPPDHELVVTTDMLASGVHFFADDPPEVIARKALRVNLSDLAAKAAEPTGFLLSLALPRDWTTDWLAAFAKGLAEDAACFDCPLIGGDTVKSLGALTLSITAIGTVPKAKMVARRGVQDGDLLYVSGTIGDAALGLRLRRAIGTDRSWIDALSQPAKDYLLMRHLLPLPRLGLRDALRGFAHAAMDISDGLVGDLAKMLALTGVTTKIALADVPLSKAARQALARDASLVEPILTGGDDYEIICAVAAAEEAEFVQQAAAAGLPVTRIGTATKGAEKPLVRDAEGRPLAFSAPSYQHF